MPAAAQPARPRPSQQRQRQRPGLAFIIHTSPERDTHASDNSTATAEEILFPDRPPSIKQKNCSLLQAALGDLEAFWLSLPARNTIVLDYRNNLDVTCPISKDEFLGGRDEYPVCLRVAGIPRIYYAQSLLEGLLANVREDDGQMRNPLDRRLITLDELGRAEQTPHAV
jgi:hypothetical protein